MRSRKFYYLKGSMYLIFYPIQKNWVPNDVVLLQFLMCNSLKKENYYKTLSDTEDFGNLNYLIVTCPDICLFSLCKSIHDMSHSQPSIQQILCYLKRLLNMGIPKLSVVLHIQTKQTLGGQIQLKILCWRKISSKSGSVKYCLVVQCRVSIKPWQHLHASSHGQSVFVGSGH